jgi:hypothetical protein
MKRPNVLYHFTSRLWWRFIETEGIVRGVCPVTRTRVLDYPNLTSDPEPASQPWAGRVGQSVTVAGKTVLKKTNTLAVRITVRVPKSDSALVLWEDLASQRGTDDNTFKLYKWTGGNPRKWWIYMGTIPPRFFKNIEFLDDGIVAPTEQQLIDLVKDAKDHKKALTLME